MDSKSKYLNSSAETSSKRFLKLNKPITVLGGIALLMLLMIFGTVLIITSNCNKLRINVVLNSTNSQLTQGNEHLLLAVPRLGWLAQPPINDLVPLNLPIERVILIPTRTSECETQAACTYMVRIIQTYNIESQQRDDIIYNFLIGGDGNVYEGRGWNNRGSVLKGFNEDSISFAYIGSFKKQPPSYKQLNVTKLLLEEGVRLNKLSSDYRLVAANKLDPTVATTADALYKSFESWPHWSEN